MTPKCQLPSNSPRLYIQRKNDYFFFKKKRRKKGVSLISVPPVQEVLWPISQEMYPQHPHHHTGFKHRDKEGHGQKEVM